MSGGFDDEGPRWPERDINREPPREPPPPPGPGQAPGREPFYRPTPAPTPAPIPEPQPPIPEPQPPIPEPQPPIQPIPPTESSEPTTSLGDAIADSDADGGGWDPRRDGDRRRPTTAEQAVPWLIGLLLGMTGIVIVLLALIFIGPEGVSGLPTASPTPSTSAPPSPTLAGSPTPIPTAAPTPTPPPPTFGALEMTYLGRATANSPIRLSRRDFSTTTDPVVIAEDPKGVTRYAWSPDGRVGVAIISGRAVAIVPAQAARTITDPVDALVFGDDSSTLFGLRIVADGANDRAEVLSINFETGVPKILATITYPHPDIFPDPALKEAQFADNGGVARLWVTTDGNLVAWIIGAPGAAAYRIDPATGTFAPAARQPVLWSPNQRTRVNVTESGGVTNVALVGADEVVKAAVKVTGLVSHVRWAGSNNEIVFTLGRLVGGGVRQDLYVWDLVNAKAPLPLTSNGASFGAEWLGVLQSWAP